MASPELQTLWQLAQIDNRLVEVRTRAATLDVGQKIAEEIKRLEAEEAEVGGEFHTLHREQLDLELAQKSIQDKIKKLDQDLYSGKVVSPREVENIQKEIAGLKRQIEDKDERLLELLDLVPPAKAAHDKVLAAIDAKKKALAARRQEAIKEKQTLESDFKSLSAARPEAAKKVQPGLLVKYDGIRTRHAGIGMVSVNTRTANCNGCGTHLPDRTIIALREEKTVTCETCYRLLYYTDGLI